MLPLPEEKPRPWCTEVRGLGATRKVHSDVLSLVIGENVGFVISVAK